ncbi:MAG: type II secretion system F family protein [Proteobacteria bacterium]|nr:type II secretion system F family protein [Pseudomonadota bacterium]
MGVYKYKSVDSSGKRKFGLVSGGSMDLAKSQLARMRHQVIAIEEIKEDGAEDEGLSLLGGRIKIDKKGNMTLSLSKAGAVADKDLIVFSKQLQTMLSSGLALNQSLEILSRQQRNPQFGKVIAKVQKTIEEGSKFSQALEKHPVTFDNLFVSMVRAGEESGKISEILNKLVIYIEKASRIKGQVKSAMMYPAIILVVAISVVVFLLVVVVPKFVAQFKGSGHALPGLTQFVIDLSDGIAAKFPHILASIVVFGYAFMAWSKTKKGQEIVHAFALKAPVIGDLVRKVAVGRFCATLSSMLMAGVNIIQALSICASSSGNVVIEKFILYARSKVEQGQLLSVPVSENKLFPPMVVSMMEVGEKAGKMDEMLAKVSEFYDEEVEVAVKGMLGLIEPILIVGIGVIVGTLVVAMYLPILEMGQV